MISREWIIRSAMPRDPSLGKVRSLATFNRRERFLEAFERAWQERKQPRLEDFLPGPGPDRRPVLIDLIRADLECRLKANLPARVEDYLARFPELKADAAVVLDLLTVEVRHQERRHGSISVEE